MSEQKRQLLLAYVEKQLVPQVSMEYKRFNFGLRTTGLTAKFFIEASPSEW